MRACSCFSSPIKRGWNFAELVWADREGPLVPMDNLREAHLGWLQGMRQGGSLLFVTIIESTSALWFVVKVGPWQE